MEAVVFLGLLGTGYLMNKDPHEKSPQNKVIDDKESITDAGQDKSVSNLIKVAQKVKIDPNTLVRPFFYNSLHIAGSVNKVPNTNYDPDLIFVGIDPKFTCKELKSHSMNDGVSLAADLKNNGSTNIDLSENPSQYETIPHEENRSEEKNMVHNNMVPFYKGNITQNVDPNNRLNAHKLELYTGTYHLRKHNKEEQQPLFAPTKNLTNIYGSVQQRDLDRYHPSNTGKKNNELPFNQIRVGHGLNKGFTSAPSGGFHDFTRIMPKANDALYVNPKIEAEGRMLSGKAQIDNPTLNSATFKNKQTLLVENKNGERNFTTTGAVTGRELRPDIIVRNTRRKKSKMYIGTAGAEAIQRNRSECLMPKMQETHRRNFRNTPYRNYGQTTGNKMNDLGKGGYENKANERQVTGVRSHLTNLKTYVNQIISQFTDSAKYTRKQEYIKNARETGNLNRAGQGHIVYDPNDVAKTTIRQTTENFDYLGGTKQIGAGKGLAYDPNDVAKTTIRQTTENFDYLGGTKQIGAGQGVAYDPNDVARTTIRQTTENFDYLGGTRQIGAGQGIAYDPNDVARTTIRQTTERDDHIGLANPLQKRHIVYDPDDVAKTTIKETTHLLNHKGVATPLQKRHIVYDPDDVAKTTIRETTENDGHLGNVSGDTNQNGGAYEVIDVQAKNTNRQFTQDNQYIPNAGPSKDRKATLYDPYYNARTNSEKEIVAEGRSPTQRGATLSTGVNTMIQNYDVRKCEDDYINRRAPAHNNNMQNTSFYAEQNYGGELTTVKGSLPQNDRLDLCIFDAYKSNPLTQSLSSY